MTEDWFALSHFKQLMALLVSICGEVVLVARCSGREDEIEAMGIRVVDFDYRRATMNAFEEFKSTVRLARIFRAEQPDAVHLVAMKPIVLGSLATRLAKVPAVIVHMTGLGHLAISRAAKAQIARRLACRLITVGLRAKASHLLVENPEDLAFLEGNGVRHGGRFTILGGAGVDPDAFFETPQPDNAPLVAASVGRMIRSKGLDVLVAAHACLNERGISLNVELYGGLDDGNPEALTAAEIEAWTRRPGVKWHDHVQDVHDIWRQTDIAVLPARSREGMPLALLEAAASARPLIVTDVPGCRYFVRHEVEGLLVPPEDACALADALARLAGDAALRAHLGTAARQRVLDGFTKQHLIEALRVVYGKMLMERRAR